jgi:hypothetical protein
MKIEGVVISCYRFDLELTRVCVASIRYWYPDIPIWLLKDRHYGEFSTREIEKHWCAEVYPQRGKTLGWGFGKLEVMTELPRRRFLFVDSDIVFAGRVIEHLEQFDEDFIVDRDYAAAIPVEQEFFALTKLAVLDPSFRFPGFGFNGGQILANTGTITKQDLNGLMNWQTRRVEYPDIFRNGDQGLLNYVVLRKLQHNELTLRREPLMAWPGGEEAARHIQLSDFTPEGKHHQVIHWAGLRWGKTIEEMPRSEVLRHFEDVYYRRVGLGSLKRRLRWTRFRIDRDLGQPLRAKIKKTLRLDRST